MPHKNKQIGYSQNEDLCVVLPKPRLHKILYLDIEKHLEVVGLRHEQHSRSARTGAGGLVSGLPRTKEIVAILRALSETQAGAQP